MKKLITITSLILVAHLGQGQDCNYFDPVHGVYAELDVFFGIDTRFNGAPDSLFMDIYKPVGDDNEARPVIFWYYGGGFSGGNRQEMATFCQLYASRGFVAVAADYRLGFETPLLVSYPYAYDPNELVRANYRAMQDAKGAIRFMKLRAAQDSTDVNNFFAGGFSAGGFTALAAGFWDLASEKPVSCGAIGPANNNIPASPRPDLGPVEGHLYVGEADATLKGIVNIFGGMVDTTLISDNTGPAVYMYHQSTDPIVFCGHKQAYWNIPLGVPNGYPWVHGSCDLEDRFLFMGYTPDQLEFYEHPGNEHAVHDVNLIDSLSARFVERLICTDISTSVTGEETVELAVYPNPFSNSFWLSPKGLPSGIARLELINTAGQVLLDSPVNIEQPGSPIEIQAAAALPTGLYFIRISLGSKIYFTKILKS
ncbi:MAG: carboxylesterase family protein [Saprospiraceae bacterium]|nr:carboxylesterase family protein [Saprospiraceae bacterium]